jgi:hypothetical protein
MGDVTDIGKGRTPEPLPPDEWSENLEELRADFHLPDYLTDDQAALALAAWGLANHLRVNAETEGRREIWTIASHALADALSFESLDERDGVKAKEREQIEAERRRGEMRGL